MDEELRNYVEGLTKGRPVFEALMKIDNECVVKSVLCASIDAWCVAHGVDALNLIDEMANAMYEVNEQENDV